MNAVVVLGMTQEIIEMSRSELVPIMEDINKVIEQLKSRLQSDPENYGFIISAIECLEQADSMVYHCLVE